MLFAALFPVALVVNLTRYAGWTPVAMGVTIGIYVAVSLRTYFLTLTDHRLLVTKLARLSSKRVEAHRAIDRNELEVELRPRVLSDLMTIRSHAFTEKLQVPMPYRERAAELVTSLRGGAGGS